MPRNSGTHRTLAEYACRRLEHEILAGIYRPGDRLDELRLAQRFHLSRTPIREALRQLTSEGLVEMRPRQGAFVARLSVQRLIEMFEVMAELEGMCARLAARRMTADERAELACVHRECGKLVKAGDPDAYYAKNKEFHEAIYAGSHNGYLEETTRSLRSRLSVYRRYQLHHPGRLGQSFAEHEAALRAIERREDATADKLMRQHVTIQGDVLADLISALPTLETAERRP